MLQIHHVTFFFKDFTLVNETSLRQIARQIFYHHCCLPDLMQTVFILEANFMLICDINFYVHVGTWNLFYTRQYPLKFRAR